MTHSKKNDMEARNYETYHLHELERALASINEQENPEEARVIREYIARGGYQYPEHLFSRATFTSKIFREIFIGLAALLLLSYSFGVLRGYWLALVPLIAQVVLLFMILTRHQSLPGMLKLWALAVSAYGAYQIYTGFRLPYGSVSFEDMGRFLIPPALSLLMLYLSRFFIVLTSEQDARREPG